jgi:predicted RNA-binding Zn-ribbon protein involved in translation (DUF1610 family)
MSKELTPEGPRFFCAGCDGYSAYDEVDMEPFCPVCGDKLQFCAKCGQSYFCNTCNGLVSRKRIAWKEK